MNDVKERFKNKIPPQLGPVEMGTSVHAFGK